MRELIDSYDVEADNVKGNVRIYGDDKENVPVYELEMPIFEAGTLALMNELKDEMIKEMDISVEEITDPRKIRELKERFYNALLLKIKTKLPKIDEEKRKVLAGVLLHEVYGLGWVEVLLGDNFLEEVAINNSNTGIVIYHKKYGWLKMDKKLNSELDIYNLASQIGRKVNREITMLNPIMDAYLLTGDRVAATLFPISTSGNTITIRRFARVPWTIISLIEGKTLSKEVAAFLWLCVQYEINILIAGGTASGKTSFLNAISAMIPPTQRTISIEDTREISLPGSLHWNWIPLNSREKNPEGKGKVSMLDLMIASLRMRPDRIIVGEVRKKEQADTMFEAMHTGHSVMTTMHADTVEQIKRRLIEKPIAIPKNEIEALQLIVVQFRDRRRNIRRTLEVAEILQGGEKLETSTLFRWHPRDDIVEMINNSSRIFESINLHTGMTLEEIKDNLKEKERILDWMIKNKIIGIDNIGKVMEIYYKDPKQILERIDQGKSNVY